MWQERLLPGALKAFVKTWAFPLGEWKGLEGFEQHSLIHILKVYTMKGVFNVGVLPGSAESAEPGSFLEGHARRPHP